MKALITVVLLLGMLTPGCIRLQPDPIEVKPIHITVDVNLRVQRELDDFFGDIDAADPTLEEDPATETE